MDVSTEHAAQIGVFVQHSLDQRITAINLNVNQSMVSRALVYGDSLKKRHSTGSTRVTTSSDDRFILTTSFGIVF